ncbi:MAG: endolytic transglycosylase MltG [Coriobacteriales bacterium]|jgi:UPF0755 protein|nr:endolytic transglycosylase MltG [Coriobacteriales bacterium]
MSDYSGKHRVSADGTRHAAQDPSKEDFSRFSRKNVRTGMFSQPSQLSPDQERAFVDYTVGGSQGAWGAKGRSPWHTVVPVVVAVVVLAALAFGAFKLAQSLGIVGGGGGSKGVEVAVFIPEGSSTADIARALRETGVISKESSFISAVTGRGVESRLQPGHYALKTGMEDNDAVDALLAGPQPDSQGGNKLTIPEGLTIEATAARVEEACGIPADQFVAEAHSADKYVADYPFLEGVYDNSMEGFLYPKTYQIPAGSDAAYVVRVLLDQFAIETSGLDLSYAAERNLTLYDLVIMASMIEKETAEPDERPMVSSVLYNRLHEGMLLQICSTVVFAIGLENYDGHPLLETDLAIESAYNTYQNAGLPAGPICSPHISSIEAAANPAETDYLYYVLTSKEGTHTFCVTYEEFEAANVVYHELFNVPN